jgi:hypothetical protein
MRQDKVQIRPPAIRQKGSGISGAHRGRSTRSSRTRAGSNWRPPSPTAGCDSPLPGRRALGGFKSMLDRRMYSQRVKTNVSIAGIVTCWMKALHIGES